MAYGETNAYNPNLATRAEVNSLLANKLANRGEVEFNQLFENESAGSQSLNGITRVTTPYTYKISGTATATDYIWAKTKAITSGHKFYFANLGSNEIRVQNYGVITSGSAIITPTTAYLQYAIDFTSGQTYNVEIKPILIDLTTMFGSGQEPDLATCQAIFSADYYAYESGKTCMLVADNSNNACFIPKDQLVGMRDLADRVVEEGKSGVWTYRKWASGIAECFTHTPITKTMTPNQAWGSLYNTGNDTIGAEAFPFEFISAPTECAKMSCGQGGWQNWENTPTTTTSGSYQWIRPTSGGTAQAKLYLYEIGYWK